MSAEKITLEVETSEGDLVELVLPTKFELCPRCRGEGSHVNPAIDGNGLTAEDFDEAGEDFRENYMAGVYDVACYKCQGKRVVAVPDMDKLTAAEKILWKDHVREEADYQAIVDAERRMGA